VQTVLIKTRNNGTYKDTNCKFYQKIKIFFMVKLIVSKMLNKIFSETNKTKIENIIDGSWLGGWLAGLIHYH
jgi:hypothetical protein